MLLKRYGHTRLLLHWLIALAIIALFILGEWMVDLDYYHRWYNRAPDWHRSVGLLLVAVLGVRVIWRLFGKRVYALASHKPWERIIGRLMHSALDLITLLVIVSGYLISTADGRAVAVFDWFAVPALYAGANNQESIAGLWHEWLSIILIMLACLHALAALKHHFVDRDETLRRMCGLRPKKETGNPS